MQSFKLRNNQKAKAFSHAIALLEGKRNAGIRALRTDLCATVAGNAAAAIRQAVPALVESVLEAEGLVTETRTLDAGAWAPALAGRWRFDAPWAIARDAAGPGRPGASLLTDAVAGSDGEIALPYAVKVYDRVVRTTERSSALPRSSLANLLGMRCGSQAQEAAIAAIREDLRRIEALHETALANLADAAGLFRAFDACQTNEDLIALFPAAAGLFVDHVARADPDAEAARILRDLA